MSAKKDPTDDNDDPATDSNPPTSGLPYWLNQAPRGISEGEILQAFRNPVYDTPADAWPDQNSGDGE